MQIEDLLLAKDPDVLLAAGGAGKGQSSTSDVLTVNCVWDEARIFRGTVNRRTERHGCG